MGKSAKTGWKWSYYEALIHWQNNQPELAKSLFNSCGTEPDFVPFYLAKAELFKDDSEIVRISLEAAYRLDSLFWRTGLRLTQFYGKEKELDKALTVASQNYKSHPKSFIIGLQYAQMLKLNGRYADALGTLSHLEMLPAEGDVNAHSLFRETNILYAFEQMKTGNWEKAVLSLQKAETWPENLFSGEPYFPDNRVTQFLAAYCYEKLKDKSQADKSFAYLKSYKNPDGWTSPLGNLLTKLAVEGEMNYKTITEALLKESANDRDKDLLTEFLTFL